MSATVAGLLAAKSRANGHSIPPNMGALTSLRALLAWWVVIFHASPLAPFHLDQSRPILGKGPIMVDCFFVLSGFVLFHMHPLILSGPHKAKAVAHFLAARLARLYPVHLAVLLGFILLIGGLRLATGFRPADPAAFSAFALLRQLLLLHGIVAVDHRSWNFPSWSISSEWAAYILAPLLFLVIHRAPRGLLLVATTMAGLVVLQGVATGWNMGPLSPLVRVTLEFVVGASLRRLAAESYRLLAAIRVPGLIAGWSLTLLLALSRHDGLFFAALIALVVFLSLTPGWGGAPGRIGRYFGESSYAVYMVHALVLTVWAGLASRLALNGASPFIVAIMLCLTIQAAASLLHHLIERPARTAMRAWTGRIIERRSATETENAAAAFPNPAFSNSSFRGASLPDGRA